MAKKASKKAVPKVAAREVIPRARREIVSVSVRLQVITPDRLKKMIFEFNKGTSQGVTTWKINFELFTREKKTDGFGEAIVDLDVKVDAKNNELAEATADKGMNRPQVRHAITRSAPAAERFGKDQTSSREKRAKKAVQDVLPARLKT